MKRLLISAIAMLVMGMAAGPSQSLASSAAPCCDNKTCGSFDGTSGCQQNGDLACIGGSITAEEGFVGCVCVNGSCNKNPSTMTCQDAVTEGCKVAGNEK